MAEIPSSGNIDLDRAVDMSIAERIDDVLDEPLEGRELREAIINRLNYLYDGYGMEKYLTQLVSMTMTAYAEAEQLTPDKQVEPGRVGVYTQAARLGSLMAIHTVLPEFKTRSARTGIINSNLYKLNLRRYSEEYISATHLGQRYNWEEQLDMQDEDMQHALCRAADQLYDDYPSELAGTQRQHLIFGYFCGAEKLYIARHRLNRLHGPG